MTALLTVDKLMKKDTSLSVVGLGYVGLPLAVAFARTLDVIGYDIDEEKIKRYQNGEDETGEVGNEALFHCQARFTHQAGDLKKALFHVVAVPTPINSDKTPDLAPVEKAARLVGSQLKPGAVVVFESTVYPGVTEDICVPLLEEASGLVCGQDFWVGYSPERINPGDRVHRLETIVKIVSGQDETTREAVAGVYELIIDAGVHRVNSIKAAEAAKVVENSQRDINIAFMNELAMVFDRMDIDTKEVIEAMNTKWNALKFTPGLVGGHCIGVDPYYFIYEAAKLGYHSQIILSGRKINDGMGDYVADVVIRELIRADKTVRRAKVAVLGAAFKENCADMRNSKVIDVIRRLESFGLEPLLCDPWVKSEDIKTRWGIKPVELKDICGMDCVVLAVAHKEFCDMSLEQLETMMIPQKEGERILIDVKSVMDPKELERNGIRSWRL